MALLNLLYADTAVANLLMYGVEGVHYVRSERDSDVLTWPENCPPEHYTGMSPWYYCNQYAADRWESYAADIWETIEQANLSAIRSPAVGFAFDSAPVARQLHACDEVLDHYLPLLESGILDPAQLLPEFRQALREAGIEDIVKEKQLQLDAYIETHTR
jgi:putative aldouronate transport system substrate-binding protein